MGGGGSIHGDGGFLIWGGVPDIGMAFLTWADGVPDRGVGFMTWGWGSRQGWGSEHRDGVPDMGIRVTKAKFFTP